MTKFDIATSMDGIMKSASYQAVFAKPQPQFNKTAAKKKDEKDEEPKGKKGKKPEVKEEPKGKKGKKPEEDKKTKKKANKYQACVMGLAKISELLDKAGLEKEATYALLALDGLVKSAQSVDPMTGAVVSDNGGEVVFPEDSITVSPGAARKAPGTVLPITDPNDPLNFSLDSDDGAGDCDMASDKKKDEEEEEEEEDEKEKDEDDEEEEEDEDKNDVFHIPAGHGAEESIEFLGGKDVDFPLGEQWAKELDDEEIENFKGKAEAVKDMAMKAEEDEGEESALMQLIEDLEGEKASVASKKLTSLQKLAAELEKTRDFLAVKAAGKKGDVDPKAKVRNKPAAIFGDKHPKVKDKKDHFPIDTIGRARNALAQAQKFDAAPSWWSGSLKELQNAVKKAVKSEYPSIEVDGKDKGKKKA